MYGLTPGHCRHFLHRHRRGVLLFVLSASLSLLFAVQVWSWDVWWHLATGRWIVENRAIPTTDPFSFTVSGTPWINVNWLGALLLYAAYSLGGVAGIVVLKIFLGFGLVLFLGLSLSNLNVRSSFIAATLICITVMVQPRFAMARPLSIGAMLCSVGMYLSARSLIKRDKSVLLLIPLMLLWMNVHSSALLVPIMNGIVCLVPIFIAPDRTYRRLTLLSFAGTTALLVGTQRGRDILTQALSYDPSSLIVMHTIEWQPLEIGNPVVWVPWSLFAIAVAYGLYHFRKYPLPLGLALLGTLLGTGFSRHLYIGILLAAPMIALTFQGGADALKRRGLALAGRAVPVAMILSVLGLHLVFHPQLPLGRQLGFGLMPRQYPREALRILKQLPTGRTMNDYRLGGYLIWHGIPGGVYIDGRTAQVFQERHVRDLLHPIAREHGGIDRLADRYHIVYALGFRGAPVYGAAMSSPHWVPLYFGDNIVLFVRESHVSALLAAGTPVFPSLRHRVLREPMKQIYDELLSSPEDEKQLTEEFVQAAAMEPTSHILGEILRFLYETRPALAARIQKRLPERQ